jgi:hypothetical protein
MSTVAVPAGPEWCGGGSLTFRDDFHTCRLNRYVSRLNKTTLRGDFLSFRNDLPMRWHDLTTFRVNFPASRVNWHACRADFRPAESISSPRVPKKCRAADRMTNDPAVPPRTLSD